MGFETSLLLCDVLRRPGRFWRVLVCVLCLLVYRGCGSARGTGWQQGDRGRPGGPADPGKGFSMIGSETKVLALALGLARGRGFLC